MSRNLLSTDCYFCHTAVELVGSVHPITKDEAGGYFDEYEGLVVANASCPDCKAKYLAWVDETPRNKPSFDRVPSNSVPFFDLSFRSTFNDEPGDEDMPTMRCSRKTRAGHQCTRLGGYWYEKYNYCTQHLKMAKREPHRGMTEITLAAFANEPFIASKLYGDLMNRFDSEEV